MADLRALTVVLRLVVDRTGQMVHGEMVDVQGTTIDRFVAWPEMYEAVRAWIAAQAEHD